MKNASPYLNRNFLLLWTAFFVSVLGSKLLIIALVARDYAQHGSAAQASALFALDWGTSLVVGLVLAPRIDRMRAKTALCGFNAAAGLATLPLIPLLGRGSLAAALPLLGLRAVFSHAAYTSRVKALFEFFDADDRSRFATLLNSSQYAAAGLSGALGVAILAFVSMKAVVLFDAATFFAAAALLSGARPLGHPRPAAAAAPRWTSALAEGLRAVRADPQLKGCLFYMAALSALFQGTCNTIATIVPQAWFHKGAPGSALYFAAISASVTGAVAGYQAWVHRGVQANRPDGQRFGWIATAALCYAGVGASRGSLALNLACVAGMMAFFEASWLHQLDRLVARAPEGVIARVSALEMCVTLTAMGGASMLMGTLVDAVGVQLAIASVLGILAAAIAAWELSAAPAPVGAAAAQPV